MSHQVIVRAGAGAGKTTALITEVLTQAKKFREVHSRWPGVLLTTFTRKATQEIRERLLSHEEVISQPELAAFVSSSRLKISTIHGTLKSYLDQYGKLLGWPGDVDFLSQFAERKILRKVIKRILSELTEEQKSLFDDFRIRELETILSSAIYAAKKQSIGETWTEIDLERFTLDLQTKWKSLANKVSQELFATLPSLTKGKSQENWFAFAQLLQKILEEQEPWVQLASISWPRKTKEINETLGDELTDLKELSEDLNSTPHQSQWQKKYSQLALHFGEIFQKSISAFAELKHSYGKLPLVRLEEEVFSLINQHPHSARAFALDWDIWLVDEFQDTSEIQRDILLALSSGQSLFVVGDPQQSIYLFRGAEVRVFSELEDSIRRNRGEERTLLKNYRSHPELVDFFAHLFPNMDSQFVPMEAGKRSQDFPTFSPRLVWYSNDEARFKEFEVLSVVDRIQSLRKLGISFSQIAILARTNSEIEIVSRCLAQHNLPYEFQSSSSLYSRSEVKDFIALLKFLVNPHDNENLVRLFRSRTYFVESDSLKTLLSQTESYWSALLSLAHPSLDKLRSLLKMAEAVGISSALWMELQASGVLGNPHSRNYANLVKFWQHLRKQETGRNFSYAEFIHQGDLTISLEDEDLGEALPLGDSESIHLLTIHASKGLQFPHVLIVGMNKAPVRRQYGLLRVHTSQSRWSIPVYNDDGSERVWPGTADKADQELDEREFKESQRLFYVACTRAQESLTFIGSGRKSSKSWAAQLSSALKDKSNDIHFIEETPKSSELAEAPSRINPFSQKPLAGNQKNAVNLVTTDLSEYKPEISITQLIKHKTIRSLDPVKDPESTSIQSQIMAIGKMLKGIELHRIFECYRGLGSPEDLLVEDLLSQLRANHKQVSETIYTCLQAGEREFGFSLELPACILRGQIDAFHCSDESAYIVDYKTGSSSFSEAAMTQLRLYTFCLHHMGLLKASAQVSLIVYFVLENTAKEVHYSAEELKSSGYFAQELTDLIEIHRSSLLTK
jgi:ATP-dependent helicase/nuclease subunit A